MPVGSGSSQCAGFRAQCELGRRRYHDRGPKLRLEPGSFGVLLVSSLRVLTHGCLPGCGGPSCDDCVRPVYHVHQAQQHPPHVRLALLFRFASQPLTDPARARSVRTKPFAGDPANIVVNVSGVASDPMGWKSARESNEFSLSCRAHASCCAPLWYMCSHDDFVAVLGQGLPAARRQRLWLQPQRVRTILCCINVFDGLHGAFS